MGSIFSWRCDTIGRASNMTYSEYAMIETLLCTKLSCIWWGGGFFWASRCGCLSGSESQRVVKPVDCVWSGK